MSAYPTTGAGASLAAQNPATLQASRREDRRLVTGQGKFTADWNLPGQVFGAVVRADRPHARILSCDWSAVRAAPGVLAVLTADDVTKAGFQGIPVGGPLKGRDGQPHRVAPLPVLAADKVRYLGQAVAMVIAQTVQQARLACELAVIDYEDLPAAVTPQAALADGAPLIHDHAPGNLPLDFENGDEAAVAAAFAAAAHVSTVTINSQRLIGAPMELKSVLADCSAGRSVVYTATQGVHGMRSSLSAVTGWPLETIEVVAQDVGGSFGLRGGASCEHALVMLASRQLGRPVKYVATRSELFIAEWHGRALQLTSSIALSAAGDILAIRFADTVDLGAYSCYWGSFIGARNISVTMGGVYKVPALYMRSRLVYTNTMPVGAYRGAGRPDIAYAIERLVDYAAAEHGFDPIALRRRNFIAADAFPYRTANGTVYDCGDFEGAMDQALKAADFDGFAARRADSARHGRLRGIGVATYLEASGAGGAPMDQVTCEFGADGMLTLYGVTGPSGQGHETSFISIVADGLGIDPAGVRYRASDKDHLLVGNGTGGSRSLYGAGSAFKHLVPAIIDRARPLAARELGVEPAQLAYEAGAFIAPGNKRLGLVELARKLAGPSPHPLDSTGEATSGVTYPNGCHVAEVEIEPDTGVTTVCAYVAVDDLGNVISPQLVRGQVHGGVMQGAGQAFGEHAIYDEETGQLLTGSFMDYPMPRAGWAFDIQSLMHPVPTAANPLGAKGVGESGCSGSLPALANAVVGALRPLGVSEMDMPYTPARVWQRIQAAGGAKALAKVLK